MRHSFFLILFFCATIQLYGQSYRVEIYARGAACNPHNGNSHVSIGVSLNGRTGSHDFNSHISSRVKIFDEEFTSIPTGPLHIHSFTHCQDCPGGRDTCESDTDEYTNDRTIDFSGITACRTINIPVPIELAVMGLELIWTPVYNPVSNSQITQSGIDICDGQNLILTTVAGYSNYVWQYKDSSMPAYQSFNTNPGNTASISFGADAIYGPAYQDKLGSGNTIQFQYGLGTCAKVTTTVPVHFFPKAPQVLSESSNGFSVTHPSCFGQNGSISITQLNRNMLSGETLNISIYNPGADVTHGGVPIAGGQNSSVTALPITFNNIPPGSYKLFAYSYDYQCGDPDNPLVMPFTINGASQVSFTASSPTSPSCHANTTGVKNDGHVTIDPGGGSGLGFEYAVGSGSFQAAGSDPFIISGLSVGSYSIKVRDGKGCEAASPQSVNILEPTELLVGVPIVKDATCFGQNSGQITMNPSGTGPFEYAKDGSNFLPGNVIGSLVEGTYTITVRDGKNCTRQTASIPVDAPDQILATATPAAATCNGIANGSITMSGLSGGAGGFTFSTDNGINFYSTLLLDGLLAKPYTVIVKDSKGCTVTRNVTVTQPLAIGISTSPTLVTCSGGNDGKVKITAINAVGTPTYSLNGGTFQTSDTFTGLTANNYTLAVKDGNGCLGNGNVTINANAAITADFDVTLIKCNGDNNGAINLTPGGGGLGPYTFIWSNGQTTEDISGLTANTYSVTIKDNLGCTQNFSRILTQPLPVAPNATPSNYNGSGVRCFGNNNGSINTAPTGGNGGYTYNWSNTATTQNISTLTAGNYTVTVTDNKGCQGNQTVTITQPAQLVLTPSPQNISCFGGNNGIITLNATGGTVDYEYSANNGTSWQPTATFGTLTANSYTTIVRDENGCTDTKIVTLTSPTDLILGVTNGSTTCNQSNGTAQATATGGVSNYNFTWFNSSNTQIGTNNTINNLAAGIYRVVVTDQNSCTKQQNVTISSSDGPAITTTSITAASCSNRADGTATINITQGQAPYTILWPNNQTTATATNLAGGDYIVQVRDNTNCLALQTVTVPAPPELMLQTITQQDPNCNNSADGQITVNAQGGNGTYSYSWNTGSTNNALTNLTAGTYTVTTKDIKNCQTIQQYTLTNPPLFTINIGADEMICEGQVINKSINVDNATYAWTGPNNFTNTQQQVNVSDPGTYTLTVTNQNGCKATDSFTLTINTDLLKADFLMVTEAFAGDTVIVIDISWPIPTSVNWQFETGATIIDQSPDYALIRYDEPGTYNTTMQAQLAQCVSTYSQPLIILEKPDDEEGGKKGRGTFKIFHVYPNPVREKLTIQIELHEIRKVQLELYHLNNNRRELSQILDEDSHYETQIDLSHLEAGLYVIAVRAGNELKSVKVIKL